MFKCFLVHFCRCCDLQEMDFRSLHTFLLYIKSQFYWRFPVSSNDHSSRTKIPAGIRKMCMYFYLMRWRPIPFPSRHRFHSNKMATHPWAEFPSIPVRLNKPLISSTPSQTCNSMTSLKKWTDRRLPRTNLETLYLNSRMVCAVKDAV